MLPTVDSKMLGNESWTSGLDAFYRPQPSRPESFINSGIIIILFYTEDNSYQLFSQEDIPHNVPTKNMVVYYITGLCAKTIKIQI